MADIYLPVPLLNQHNIFPTKNFSKNYACWYTSALMVLLFKMGVSGIASSLQIDTLKRLFDNLGLGANDDAALARECGFEHSPPLMVLGPKTLNDYQKALQTFGPLIMSQPTHVIVVRGATKNVALQDEIIFNDPWDGREKKVPLQIFNNMIAWQFPIHFRRSRFSPPSVLAPGPNQTPYKTRY